MKPDEHRYGRRLLLKRSACTAMVISRFTSSREACSNPYHNAHVETIEITYPYHPQCGVGVVVRRRRKRGGQEMYDTIDVHGGSAGVPVWMTEPRWRNLRVVERAILPVAVLRELRELLLSQKSCLNAGKLLHGEQHNDEEETAGSSAQTEDKQEASE